jgi:hypothetical protein
MRIKAKSAYFRTYLDKKRFSLLPAEQRVYSRTHSDGMLLEEKFYQRKVWEDRITKEKWAFVQNGYWKLSEVEGRLVADI